MGFQCDACGEWVRIPVGVTPRVLTTGGNKTPAARVVRVGSSNVHRCEIDTTLGAPAEAPLMTALEESWIARFGAAVYQASGMVSVQAYCTQSAALMLIRWRAISTGVTVDDVAADVLRRTDRFSPAA